jgi:hypothetical protein
MFLSRITSELKIPVLGLVDSDPYGLKILSVYMSGSKNMSYDSASLTTPDIKWLGLRPSDLDRYDLPDQCRLDMTENDIKTGKEMMKEDFIQKNPEWMKELQIMVSQRQPLDTPYDLCTFFSLTAQAIGSMPHAWTGENEEKGGDSGTLFVRIPVRYRTVSATKAQGGRLDLGLFLF